ncbi:hypothetical protein DYB28_001134 [Aphanomyces astaci]|uniref:Uncharacterized protein n=1 Tax=Aphanomyces astaci TaxID=112090 RepID=A0A3L6VER3_APHAT|nr:hypothetical protein AaE_013323 [Aphanomyces astaci]RLO07371.1 hypothetical protein DYB28_001134 [Aphanomyces astaci]
MTFRLVFLVIVLVATAAATHHCTKANWNAVEVAVHDSPLSAACAADMDMRLDDFLHHKQPTVEQTQAFDNSDNCKDLYELMQSVALDQHCAELDVFKLITWEMVVAIMDVAAYPKAAEACDKEEVKQAVEPLTYNPNLMACMSSTGLYASILTKSTPSVSQWDDVANNTACSNFYNDAQAVLKSLPHCSMEGPGGRDIHALEGVSFPIFVKWLQVLTVIHEEHLASGVNTAMMSLWGVQNTALSHEGKGQGTVIAQSMFTGAVMAFLGMFIYASTRRSGEETRRLLASRI